MHAHSSLLAEIGIDDAEIAHRQSFLAFDKCDSDLLRSLHNILASQQEELTDVVYDHLLRFPELRPLLGDEAKLAHLKRASGGK